jgi:hypothetical protein
MDIAIAPPWPTKITYHGLTVMAEVASENISETFLEEVSYENRL